MARDGNGCRVGLVWDKFPGAAFPGCPGNMAQTRTLSSAPWMPCFLHHDTWLCTGSAGCPYPAHLHTLALHWPFSLPGSFQPSPAPPHLSPPPLPSPQPSPAQQSSPAWAGSMALPSAGCCRALGTHPTTPAPLKAAAAAGGADSRVQAPHQRHGWCWPQGQEETEARHSLALLNSSCR